MIFVVVVVEENNNNDESIIKMCQNSFLSFERNDEKRSRKKNENIYSTLF